MRTPVASRVLHGRTGASSSGTTGTLPVAITTACRARSTVRAPPGPVTVTSRCPVIRPRPRTGVSPAERAQSTCPASS
ncbi:Uncharacterised protein [Mycobacteroides abscessus subsp. abscessus]|nr:Uncharacterised protein [Mycobacteroides abscessus subsp. abscessus]